MKTLNLDAMITAKRAVTSGENTYPCRAITPRVVYLIDAATKEENTTEKLRLYGDAVEALVPTMPREMIDNLDTDEIAGILELATTEVNVVKAAVADPNAQSSAPATTTEPPATST